MSKQTFHEKGSILVFFALSLTVFMLMLAFAVDLGKIYLAQLELQKTANASALAGVSKVRMGTSTTRDTVQQFCRYNKVDNQSLLVDRNDGNTETGGIVLGRIDNYLDLSSPLIPDTANPNSVQVEVKMTGDMNAPLALLLGGFTGVNNISLSAKATATSLTAPIIGFDAPPEGGTADVIPFTINVDIWNEVFSQGIGEDQYSYNGNGSVSSGSDGILEIKLYPYKKDGNDDLPGNFGLLNISDKNGAIGASTIRDQIVYGVSQAALDSIGGLVLERHGSEYYKWLKGNPGLKASVDSALNSIIGQTRTICKHKLSSGQGSNAQYQIVGFEKVTILACDLHGSPSNKTVVVQPITGNVSSQAIINSDMPPDQRSQSMYCLMITR